VAASGDDTADASVPRAYWVGTSGYNYPEWKGSFYPEKISSPKMLPYYAERLRTVEINYTFYRMPTPKLLAGWSAATPPEFRFTLKAPRRITHDARLRGCDDLVAAFCDAARTLGPKLAVLLFQLPPSLKADVGLLDGFLATFPEGMRAAFEFRHPSWHADAVYERLAAQGLALCVADSERLTTPTVATAPYGYFRLRDAGYTSADVTRWAQTMQDESRWGDVFVYFKHEAEGKGPELASQLVTALGGA
jgi:uncharacterized protein YecE (DUF72 family)|tara:strand:+ start:6361 stop:7107 length:747 start_codon:yes stop_codon:yes gene_type:complete